jgi:hypothetical protein
MAFVARKLSDEPVLIVTIDVPIERHIQSLRTLNAEVARQLEAMQHAPSCLIFDLRGLDLTCSDILLWIEECRSDPKLAIATYPELLLLAVGDQPVLPIGIRKVEQLLHLKMTHFETLPDALAFAREAVVAV